MSGQGSGRIVILNGPPRAGKSTIAAGLQARAEEAWMALGVDVQSGQIIPPHLRPGIGLRPGGERPDLEPVVKRLYLALYGSIAAHARQGFDVVADLGHHEAYSRPTTILRDCALLLEGLPVLFVGVKCSLETVMARRRRQQAGREGLYVAAPEGAPVPAPVLRWQDAVHEGEDYDLVVDTDTLPPQACIAAILAALAEDRPGPSAFERLAR